jgi:hypothetical protein
MPTVLTIPVFRVLTLVQQFILIILSFIPPFMVTAVSSSCPSERGTLFLSVTEV